MVCIFTLLFVRHEYQSKYSRTSDFRLFLPTEANSNPTKALQYLQSITIPTKALQYLLKHSNSY
jgi:hypothetical protein